MGDQVAKKISPEDVEEGEDKAKFKYAYNANNMEDPVFLHQSSVLKKCLPEFVVYQEIYETNKMYMRGVTAIEPEWLPIYVPHLCNLSEPLIDPEPRYDSVSGMSLDKHLNYLSLNFFSFSSRYRGKDESFVCTNYSFHANWLSSLCSYLDFADTAV